MRRQWEWEPQCLPALPARAQRGLSAVEWDPEGTLVCSDDHKSHHLQIITFFRHVAACWLVSGTLLGSPLDRKIDLACAMVVTLLDFQVCMPDLTRLLQGTAYAMLGGARDQSM